MIENNTTPAPESKSTRKRTLLSLGLLLGIGALATTATFTDFGNLNLGNGTDGSGIGSGSFNLKVVGTDEDGVPVAGTWQEAATAEGVDIAVAGAGTITPGDTISVELPYLNDSDVLSADIKLWLNEVPGQTSTPAYLSALRFSVLDADGEPIVEDKTFEQLNELSEAADLTPTPLVAGDQGKLTLEISLSDLGAANTSLNGGVAFIQAHFDAESVLP